MVRTCVAAGCNNTNKDGVNLFKFPKEKTLRKRWADQVKRHRDKWDPTDHSVLCSKHFEESCFAVDTLLAETLGLRKKKARLNLDAVPTIFRKPKRNLKKIIYLHVPRGGSQKHIKSENISG